LKSKVCSLLQRNILQAAEAKVATFAVDYGHPAIYSSTADRKIEPIDIAENFRSFVRFHFVSIQNSPHMPVWETAG
jgi:hypothetical protein